MLNLLFIIAPALMLFLTIGPRGIGLSGDSVTYISAANSFLDSRQFLVVEGTPMTLWPPGLPLVLALLKSFGFDILTAGKVLTCVVFGIFIYLFYKLLKFHKVNRPTMIIALALAVLSYSHVNLFRMLLTEPIFVTLQILFVYLLNSYIASPKLRSLLWLAVIAGMPALFRYAGVATVITGTVAILTFENSDLRTRIKNTFLFGLISSMPIICVLINNFIVAHTLTGYAGSAGGTFLGLWYDVIDRTGNFFLPGHGLIFYIYFGTLLFLFFNKDSFSRFFAKFHVEFLFILVYCTFLVLSSLRVYIDPFKFRYLDPIYVYFLLLVTFCFVDMARSNPIGIRRALLSFFGFVVLGHSLFQFYEKSKQVVRDGAGFYNHEKWTNSETIAWLKQNPPNLPVASNSTQAVYLFTNIRAVNLGAGCDDIVKPLDSNESVIYIWLKNEPRTQCPPESIAKFATIEKTKRFDDGEIITLKKPPSPTL